MSNSTVRLIRAVGGLVLLAALVFLLVNSSPGHEPQGEAAQMHTMQRAIYQVFPDPGSLSSGSAILIAPGLLLTANHGVSRMIPGETITVIAPWMDGWVEAKFVSRSAETDLALFSVELDCPCASLAERPPAAFEEVHSAGYPWGIHNVIITSGKVQAADETAVLSTAPITYGNSGGALYVIRGGEPRVIGVLRAMPRSSKGREVGYLSLAVPAALVRDLIAECEQCS